MSLWDESSTLLNPQNASGYGPSVLGSGPLPREFGDGILAEGEKIEITRWIDPIHRRRKAR